MKAKNCKVCGWPLFNAPKSAFYAWRERVCEPCYIWSHRATTQINFLGRIRQLLPVRR